MITFAIVTVIAIALSWATSRATSRLIVGYVTGGGAIPVVRAMTSTPVDGPVIEDPLPAPGGTLSAGTFAHDPNRPGAV